MKTKSILSIIGCAALASAGLAQAATVSSVGTQDGSAGTGFAVANWSNASVAKTYDLNNTEKYGGAGYYQMVPWTGIFGGVPGLYEAVGEPNNLGITLTAPGVGQLTTQYSTPTFLTGNPLGGAGAYVNFGGYSQYRAPNGVDLYNQGALSLNLPNVATNPLGATANWGNALSFTLSTSASFRIGIAVNSVDAGAYGTDYVSIYNPSTSSVFSAPLTRGVVPNMAFFDISGVSGDGFAVALWQTATTGPAALSLVTFDVVPEPATLGLLTAGLCTVIFLRRRRMA